MLSLRILRLLELSAPSQKSGGGNFGGSLPRHGPGFATCPVPLVGALGMYRLLHVCCMLPLIWGIESVHAQTASVPVTITLESPSAPELSPPTLIVSNTELSVQQDHWERFTVKLSDNPGAGASVDVTLAVVPLDPSDREASDLVLNTYSMTFTSLDWYLTQPVTVTPEIHTEAGEDAYTIELSASGGSTDMKTVSVTITDGIRFNRIPDTRMRTEENPKMLAVTLQGSYSPRWGVVEVRASFLTGLYLPEEEYLVADPLTLTYNESNYGETQVVGVSAKEGTPVGVYWLVLTAIRDGYDPVEERGKITIISEEYCSPVLTPVRDLDFGTWTKPEAGASVGWATVNADTGARNGMGMNPIGGIVSVGEFNAEVQSCSRSGRCSVTVSVNHLGERGHALLRGVNDSRNTVDFSFSHVLRSPDDGVIYYSPTSTASSITWPIASDLEDGRYTFRLGGKIGHINDINHQTPSDTYRGTIRVSSICEP